MAKFCLIFTLASYTMDVTHQWNLNELPVKLDQVIQFRKPCDPMLEHQVVHASNTHKFDDHYACQRPFIGTQPIPNVYWMALVKMGGCKIGTKIRNVLSTTAAGIVLYGGPRRSGKRKYIVDPTWNITIIFASMTNGRTIGNLVDEGRNVTISGCAETPQCTVWPDDSIATCLMVKILLAYASMKLANLPYDGPQDRSPFRYPVRLLQMGDSGVGRDGCSICLEDFTTLDELRYLPCLHSFHTGCIDQWLENHPDCPMCKRIVLEHYEIAADV